MGGGLLQELRPMKAHEMRDGGGGYQQAIGIFFINVYMVLFLLDNVIYVFLLL